MYKIFNALLTIIWVIDILNLNFQIGDIWVADFLDKTVQINFWAWLLIWIFVPSSNYIVYKNN